MHGSFEGAMSKVPEAVAVVEDDPGMRSALQRVLRAAGFDALGFASAEDFLDAVRLPRFGCLVLDVQLPGVSGFELRRLLTRAGTAPPVIFITAHDTAAVEEEARQLRPVAFFAKPFDVDLLV